MNPEPHTLEDALARQMERLRVRAARYLTMADAVTDEAYSARLIGRAERLIALEEELANAG